MKEERIIRELKRRLEQLPRGPTGQRQYSEDVREQVLALGDAWRVEGKSLSRLASRLGVPGSVFANWQRRKERRQKRQRKLRPVSVLATGRDGEPCTVQVSRPVVVLPNGIRIEGLELEDVVKMLSRLS